MPILFYIRPKCLKDHASQQHLLCIIFTASKQQTNICRSRDKTPNLEPLTLTAKWSKWTWNEKYLPCLFLIRTSALCFMLYAPISLFCSMIFYCVETGDYSNQTFNDCFCGKSIFCKKARGFNVREAFYHIILIVLNNLKCLSTCTVTTNNRIAKPVYCYQVTINSFFREIQPFQIDLR